MLQVVIFTLFFSICLGALSTYLFNFKMPFGFRLFLGYISPIIFVFISFALFNINISISSKVYFLTVVLLSIKVVFQKIRTFIDALKNREWTMSPFFILFAMLIVISLQTGFSNYEALRWDEYSHWMMMPKQMFYFEKLLTFDFPYRAFVPYTPGWSISLIYPQLVLKGILISDWLPEATPYSSFFLGLIFCTIIFETILLFCKKIDLKNSSFIAAITLLTILIFNQLTLFENNFLIEKPQYYLLAIFSLLIFQMTEELVSIKSHQVLLSLSLLFAYLVKDSMLILIIVLVFTFIKSKHVNIKTMILLIFPTVIAYVVWQYRLIEFKSNLFEFHFANANQILLDRSDIAYKFFEQLILLFGDYVFLLCIFGIIFLAFKNKYIFRFTVLYFLFTVVGLLFMYMFSFGKYEADALASFHRYLSLPMSLVKLSVIPVVIITGAYFFDKILSKFSFNAKYLLTVLVLILAYEDADIFYSFCQRLALNNVPLYNQRIMTESKKLISELKTQKVISPNIYIIAQYTNEFEFYVAQYSSFDSNVAGFKILQELSWGEKPVNVWMHPESHESMKRKFESVRAIWVLQTDPWIDSILVEITNKATCQAEFQNYFLIKKNNSQLFDCVSKN